jgi:hypothetical protein
MEEETGIESSMSEFDMKNVKEVVAEVQNTREGKNISRLKMISW